jgi:hypothetical protein
MEWKMKLKSGLNEELEIQEVEAEEVGAWKGANLA